MGIRNLLSLRRQNDDAAAQQETMSQNAEAVVSMLQPPTPSGTSTPAAWIGQLESAPQSVSCASEEANWIDQREAYDIMTAHLYKVAKSKNWFSENPAVASGIALRLAKGQYTLCPAADARLEPFYRAIAILNVEVAIKITSPVVSAITSRLAPGTFQIPLTSSQHVQVVETMDDVAGARKAQNACFVRTDNSLVAWCDHIDLLESSAQQLEEKMISFVWQSATSNGKTNRRDTAMTEWSIQQRTHSMSQLGHGSSASGHGSVNGLASGTSTPSVAHSSPFGDSHAIAGDNSPAQSAPESAAGSDPEKAQPAYQERTTNLQSPLQQGLSVALDIVLCFLLIRTLFQESLIDGDWTRMAIAVVVFPMFPVIMFFCGQIFSVLLQLFGPVRHLSQNSRYFSGVAPERMTGQLPHITIQMPVYKESLDGVLKPTIESLKKAISTYELQGGTASIIVSEDGMQLISQSEQEIRKEYYERNNIGWVARPPHGKDGYIRKGRFKKASNLNFTCQVSLRIEAMMQEQRPADLTQWTEADETMLYQSCLPVAVQDLHPLAYAEGNVRIGDLILLIDSDTRVPEDCFLDAASEMTQCPDVGVLQHCSGVMLVSDSYFERGIGFFTRLVNFAITFVVAGGDVAPFMGHNAFLRWAAVQEASFVDPDDGIRKVWSESHVSEDFDMALRLLLKGYITRWATYSKNGFEEGVSLTCDDELNRWQKYAFGCSELVFNRLWEWPYKSPFTALFRRFLWADGIPIHYKFAACSYIFSYYAIAAALPLTIALYFVEGWFYPVLDPVFLTPFNTWLAVVFVFIIGGNVSQSLFRYRAKVGGLLGLLFEHFCWIPFMMVFFGGMSYHVLTALLSHPLGINMTWGATVKDLEDSNFFIEVPAILKRFWRPLILCLACIVAVAVLATDAVPLEWEIPSFFTFWPLTLGASCHILYPIVLNPALLRFSF